MLAHYLVGSLTVILTFVAIFMPARKNSDLGTEKKLIRKRDWWIILVAILMFAFLALQDASSNSDLAQSYYPAFERQEYRSFEYYMSSLLKFKDPVYDICTLIAYRLGLSFYTWTALIALFFVFSVYRLIQRYSKNPALSYIVVISLGLLNFSLSALRQTIAISIICFSYEFLKNKKIVKFLLIVVLAALFHRTVLIFALAYPLYHLKAKKINILLVGGVGAVAIIFSRQLTRIYMSVFGLEDVYSSYFEEKTSLSIWGVVILGLIWIYCTFFLFRKNAKAYDRQICHLLLISTLIRVISVIWVAEFFRISMYFSVFDFLVIADASSCDNKESINKLKTVAVAIMLTAYYFFAVQKNIATYVFR